jgi:uncharacterized integral membrane protein
MRKFILYTFMMLFGIVLLVFLIANRQPVTISFDPLSTTSPAFAIGPVPLWAALISTMLLGYCLGGLGMWMSAKGTRKKASERKKEIRKLQREVAATAKAEPVEDRPALPTAQQAAQQ